jgi:hypothetical protein
LVGCAPAIRPLKVDLGNVSHLAAARILDEEASEIALKILISRSIINDVILKISIFFGIYLIFLTVRIINSCIGVETIPKWAV